MWRCLVKKLFKALFLAEWDRQVKAWGGFHCEVKMMNGPEHISSFLLIIFNLKQNDVIQYLKSWLL